MTKHKDKKAENSTVHSLLSYNNLTCKKCGSDEEKEPIYVDKNRNELTKSDIKFLMEYFRNYLETNKSYRLRIPIVTSILNLLIVSFIYKNKLPVTHHGFAVIATLLPLIVMALGILGLRATKKSYNRFLHVIPSLHQQLNTNFHTAHEAKEIWLYSYQIVIIVGLFSFLAVYTKFADLTGCYVFILECIYNLLF